MPKAQAGTKERGLWANGQWPANGDRATMTFGVFSLLGAFALKSWRETLDSHKLRWGAFLSLIHI